METIGQELKRRREERNIALRDVAEATRIGIRFLHAMETDDFKQLPGGIYLRSFIRAYAKFIGMDEDEAIVKYRKQTNQPEEEPVEAPPKDFSKDYIRDYPREESNLGTIFVAIGILALLAGGGWFAYKYFSSSSTTQVKTVSQPPITNNTTGQQTSSSSQSNNQTGLPPTTTPQTSTDSSSTPPVADELSLVFKASNECWLSVQPEEGQPPKILTIQPGEVKEFKSTSKFKVTVGNLSAVQVQVNGEDVKLPSSNGLLASNVIISKENFRDYVAAAKTPGTSKPKPTVNSAPDKPTPTGTTKPTIKQPADTTAKPVTTKPAGAVSTPGIGATRPQPIKPATTGENKPTATSGTTGQPKPDTEKPKPVTKPDDSDD
ncbi:MAG: DUF4115 domain-containing protein [Blastocatellia bacterium]|nr:DUF4115 domain-containing protein [Blastocatellia bacterium]